MPPIKFCFVNTSSILVECLQKAIAEVSPHLPSSVTITVAQQLLQQFFQAKEPDPTTIVTPANSFSFMGGGFDKAVINCLALDSSKEKILEESIQNHVLGINQGFLPPALAHTIDMRGFSYFRGSLADAKGVTSIIEVPTMEVPSPIIHDRVFYCTWALLEKLASENVETVILPAFGAGFGGVPPGTCARLMVGAIVLWYMPAPSPLARSSAVLLYLRRKYMKFGKPSDIKKIEAYYTDSGKKLFTETGKESQHWPLPWKRFIEGLTFMGH